MWFNHGHGSAVLEKKREPLSRHPVTLSDFSIDEKLEYIELTKKLGMPLIRPAIDSEEVVEFKKYLIKEKFTVFSLKEVIKYMDKKSRKEGKGGWEWKLVKGNKTRGFGQRLETDYNGKVIQFASDCYIGSHVNYYGPIPLHALKEIDKITSEYNKDNNKAISFFVSDYTPKPKYVPDPFLMVVVDNIHVDKGIGRFVIDFWDEPGFGINQMWKSDLL